MTYLQLVNNVLRRLRERTVSSVNENAYSSLIGILVNDAKKEVEDAWDWSALRTTLTATTSDGQFSYVMQGAGNDITMLSVFNDTTDYMMQYKDANWFTEQFLTAPTERGEPVYYSYNGTDPDGDTIVEVWPIPDGVYNIRLNVVVRQPTLEEDATNLFIPSQPVLLLAYAKAIEERGEDGGVMSASAYATATKSLNDAIAYDTAKHPEETIWYTV